MFVLPLCRTRCKVSGRGQQCTAPVLSKENSPSRVNGSEAKRCTMSLGEKNERHSHPDLERKKIEQTEMSVNEKPSTLPDPTLKTRMEVFVTSTKTQAKLPA